MVETGPSFEAPDASTLAEALVVIEHLRAELRERDEATQQVMYAASHDLREPARMVSSFGGLLEERYRDQLDERGRRYLDRVTGAGARLHALLDGLLSLSRLTTHAGDRLSVDCGALVARILTANEKRWESSRGRIEVGALPTLPGEPRQLETLFRALIENTLLYCGEAPPDVRVQARRDGDVWHFEVADQGIGIAESEHLRVFGVFEKGFPHHPEAGVGLGLTLARRIVERHRGRIWLESDAGKGCTVHIELPAE
jgi:light-regulated signal transduction histidine kinase (bacteriophytochrome)